MKRSFAFLRVYTQRLAHTHTLSLSVSFLFAMRARKTLRKGNESRNRIWYHGFYLEQDFVETERGREHIIKQFRIRYFSGWFLMFEICQVRSRMVLEKYMEAQALARQQRPSQNSWSWQPTFPRRPELRIFWRMRFAFPSPQADHYQTGLPQLGNQPRR